MDWRSAFLKQARSDNAIRKRLNRDPEVEFSHELHYLQMTTEKLARGYQADPREEPRHTHKGFSAFLKTLKHNPEIRRQLGYADKKEAFASYIKALEPLAEQIEKLAPSLTPAGPNAEYPWWNPGMQSVLAPAEFDFRSIRSQGNDTLARLDKLLDGLLVFAG